MEELLLAVLLLLMFGGAPLYVIGMLIYSRIKQVFASVPVSSGSKVIPVQTTKTDVTRNEQAGAKMCDVLSSIFLLVAGMSIATPLSGGVIPHPWWVMCASLILALNFTLLRVILLSLAAIRETVS